MTDREEARVVLAQPTRLIREYLQTRPAASPADVVRWLRQNGVELSDEAAGAMLAAIKTG